MLNILGIFWRWNSYRLLTNDIGHSAGARLNIRIVKQRLLRFFLLCVRTIECDGMILLLLSFWRFNRVLIFPRLPLLLQRFIRRFVYLSTKYLSRYCQASYQDELRPHPITNDKRLYIYLLQSTDKSFSLTLLLTIIIIIIHNFDRIIIIRIYILMYDYNLLYTLI